MSLPDCKDLGGEERNQGGFCPVEYYVPKINNYDPNTKEFSLSKHSGSHGFVAGCVWGDDTSWKIQYLDLSNIENGIVTRFPDKLGYIELGRESSLKSAVRDDCYDEELDFDIEFAMHKQLDID